MVSYLELLSVGARGCAGVVLVMTLGALTGCGSVSPAPLVPPSATAQTPATPADPHADLIRVAQPIAGSVIHSPLLVSGEARGTWFFEASFPVSLLDADGHVLAQRPAQAGSDWMTEQFVPFSAELHFEQPASKTGTLVLAKDNPSGLPEHADELRIPIRFE